MKSTHILHLPVNFLTMTMLDSHLGYSTSLKNPAWSNFLISFLTSSFLSKLKVRSFCLTEFFAGFVHSLCSMMFLSIPLIWLIFHANMSRLFFKTFTNNSLSSLLSYFPIFNSFPSLKVTFSYLPVGTSFSFCFFR